MKKRRKIGLGDVAHWAFRPAVWAIDFVWGTDLHSCDACAARRARWNEALSVPLWLALAALTILGGVVIWWLA